MINAEWHARHKMPKNPTMDQRVKWHLEHSRHCGCRPLSGHVLEEFKKRYLGTHQEFWVFFTRQDHLALAEWAAGCAERVLPVFEQKFPQDPRPRDAILTLRDWIHSGVFTMPVIRGASLAAHAAAREVKKMDNAACYAARAAGQAVATAHVPTHAFGAAIYAVKAVAAADSSIATVAMLAERQWQLQHLPENLRPWVESSLEKLQRAPA
jgi:hypothetical protein